MQTENSFDSQSRQDGDTASPMGEIATFAGALLRHVDAGYLSIRAFGETNKAFCPHLWASIDVANGLEPIVLAVRRMAVAAAAPQAKGVVCPPLATFSKVKSATEADLLQAPCLSVELDADPREALAKARALLGPPTVVVASGGEWTDTTTGEVQPKLHAHWRLSEAAAGEDLALLKDVRRRLTALVGGDPSNVPAVHPIRWPGTPHRKNGERWARIAELNIDAEVDLRLVVDRLPPIETTQGSGAGINSGDGDPTGTDEATRLITTGESYHGPLVALSARMATDGVAAGRVVRYLRGLLKGVPADKRDGGTPGRWQARYDSIPEIVSSAIAKYAPVDRKPRPDPAMNLAEMPEAFRKLVEVDARLHEAWFEGGKLGNGKDTSPRGLELSLTYYLARRLSEEDLAAVLRGFPYGAIGSGHIIGQNVAKRLRKLLDLAEEARRKAEKPEDAPEWWPDLKTTKEGDPRDCLFNAALILREDPAFKGKIRFDELQDAPVARDMPWHGPVEHMGWSHPVAAWADAWRPWTDNDDRAATAWCQARDVPVRESTVASAVQLVASDNRHHPVRVTLNALAWDNEARIDTWLIKYCGAIDSKYTRAVGRKFLIAAVARAFRPGCKVDTALIFEGAEDLNKSTAVNILSLRDQWFSDSISEIGTKDSAQDLRGKWFTELAELSALRSAEVENLKAYITRRIDHYRPSHGRRAADFPRHGVFFGTTNADTYLKSDTGNRRFWPVKVQRIDTQKLRDIVDQLWAEAVVAFKAGHPWWLADDEKPDAVEEQASRRLDDPWSDKVLTYARRQTAGMIQTADILQSALEVPTERHNQPAQVRVSAILKSAGWVRTKVRVGDRTVWYFKRPDCSRPEAANEGSGTGSGTTETRANAGDFPACSSVPDVPDGSNEDTGGTTTTHECREGLSDGSDGGGVQDSASREKPGTAGNTREHREQRAQKPPFYDFNDAPRQQRPGASR